MTTYNFATSGTNILTGDGSVGTPFLVSSVAALGDVQITIWETGLTAIFAAICGTPSPIYVDGRQANGLTGGPATEQPGQNEQLAVNRSTLNRMVAEIVNRHAESLHKVVGNRTDFSVSMTPATQDSPTASVWSDDPAAMVQEYGNGPNNSKPWALPALAEYGGGSSN